MKDKPENYILMIAYYFPPLGGSGALRPLKLAKHLPSFGWKPIILTVKNPDWYYASDPDLLKQLPIGTTIKKAFMFKSTWFYRLLNPLRLKKIDIMIRRYLAHPDEQIGWLPFAYFSALDAIYKHNLKVIYSTSGPMTCHIIAYLLKKKTGLPWVADFRDEWIEDPNLNLPTRFHRYLHYKIERLVVKKADKIIGMAPYYCKMLSKHTKNTEKFETILAGFDDEDMICVNNTEKIKELYDKFVISYIGLFYDTFRPNAFIHAIKELLSEGKISQKEIRIQFVGANSPNDVDLKDIDEIFEFTGYIHRKSALLHLFRSDVLLLLLSNERGKDVIPSKLFEYMASGKPILALVPSDSMVAEIIHKTKAGIVVDFNDVKSIKEVILKLFQEWKQHGGIQIEMDMKEIAKFNQKNLVQTLANILYDQTN